MLRTLKTLIAAGLTLILLSCATEKELPLYRQKSVDVETRVEDLLARMTLEEKIDQLSGEGFDTRVNKRLGIPALRMADGPAGVRWGQATSFPAPIGLAATWDEDLLHQIGKVIGREMRSKDRNFFLGPCINIHRHPLGGRNFESYGEDPFLMGRMAVGLIRGVQSEGVLACAKHYACNNQEWERNNLDVRVSERALREIYMPHFRASVQDGGVKTVMAAYNVFRGDHCSESDYLLNKILKEEWGFQGFVVSDWRSVYSTAKAANAGLDLEMPWGEFFSDSLLVAVQRGDVDGSVIDDKVRRLLRVRFESGIFDRPSNIDTNVIHRSDHHDLAREAAAKSIVLLKNDDGLLPLDRSKIKTLAVLGPNAAVARTGGGGSSMVVPPYAISALEGIQRLLGDDVEILHSPGIAAKGDVLPLPSQFVHSPDGKEGWMAQYFKGIRLKGSPVLTRTDPAIDFNWGYDAPHPSLHAVDDRNTFSVRWTGIIDPLVTGRYQFRFIHNDGVRLKINDETVLEHWGDNPTGIHTGEFELTAGNKTEIIVEYMFQGGISEITMGWTIPGFCVVDEAVQMAQKADVAIVFTGLSKRFESESWDRPSLDLPEQAKLINAVVDVNPNTIVVNQTGGIITMSVWGDRVPSILQAWYPGQEGGRAMADILFGVVNPSAKLPCSFIQHRDHTPAFIDYMNPNLIGDYHEGIYVGYRYLEKYKLEPLFAFGHGLSYTSFQYSAMNVEQLSDGLVAIQLLVKNSGDRPGEEIVQIYVRDMDCSVDRPEQELKGFAKVHLKQGETKEVRVVLQRDAFAFYSEEEDTWVIEPGNFQIRAGASSMDIRLKSVFELVGWE